MGRKSSSKSQTPPAAPPSQVKRGFSPLLGAAFVAAVAIGGGFFYWRQQSVPAPDAAAQAAQHAPVPADLKPHPQEKLPQLQFPAYAPPRPPDVIRAAYRFAAEHPEILSYVPCFCGCERNGHRGNEDCFVRARDINGDVIEWDPHGMECTVCLDVATRSAQLHASGASVRDIRATIEREWSSRSTNHTHTPPPPDRAAGGN